MNIDKRLIARGGIAAIALATAVVSGKASLALSLAERRPADALQFDSRQPTALALSAYAAVSAGATAQAKPSAPEFVRAERDALQALSIDPTNVTAVADIALVREVQGRRKEAVALMRYAQRLSRRNLVTQLWWIEYLSASGDVAGTLEHYDIALRTSSLAPSMLFPILVSASADPQIAAPLARLVAQRPVWAEQFVQHLAQSSPDPVSVGQFLERMAALGAPAAARSLVTIVDRLVQIGRGDAAWALFARYRPDAARNQIRDPDFSASPAEPTAFDWQLSQEGLSISVDPSGLRIDVAPGGGGVAARQLIKLPPGRRTLRLDYTASDSSGAKGAEPVLTVRCSGTGPSLGTTAATGSKPDALTLEVPASCPFQLLEVALQAADSPGGASVVVRAIRLVD